MKKLALIVCATLTGCVNAFDPRVDGLAVRQDQINLQLAKAIHVIQDAVIAAEEAKKPEAKK